MSNKVKVRIAVAVDHTRRWAASGWGDKMENQKDDLLMGFAIETLENGEKQYFLEAELEMPTIEVITPTVMTYNAGGNTQ